MVTFSRAEDLRGAVFDRVDLTGARIHSSDLYDVVMRAVDVHGMDIDAPFLFEGGGVLLVNGVDVIPLVDAELDRRFPGREQRNADDPAGLRAAWEVLQRAWADALERVAEMPPGTVDVSVAGEWSFAQTLRHLVMATDTWLGRAILRLEQPYHPLGLAFTGAENQGFDTSGFVSGTPDYADVLQARADRVAMVSDFLADVTDEQLTGVRSNPWAPDHQETVLSCLHTILGEEWDHLRYALRDLDTLT